MKQYAYQEQLLEWKKNIIYLKDKYASTPAGFISEEEKQKQISEYQAEYAEYINHTKLNILDKPLPSINGLCIGRKNELSSIHNLLQKKHVVLLSGMGGIGKSTLAIQYVKDFGEKYDHILYLIMEKSIEHAICDDEAVPISGLFYNRQKYESQHKYFTEKINVLKELCAQSRILIILDNFNSEKDKHLPLILSMQCDKIITSRITCKGMEEIPQLQIQAVHKDYWPIILKAYATEDNITSEKQLLNYAERTHGHTLTLRLAAIHGGCSEFDSSSDYFTALISSFKLGKKEMTALLYLSVFGPKGILKDLFLLVTGIPDKTIESLQKYFLVDIVSFDGQEMKTFLSVHPLIAEAVKSLTPPTCQNCSSLLRGFESFMNGELTGRITWDRSYEENRRLEPYIFSLYETFPDPAPWLGKAFEEIATFLWIQGYYDEALSYAMKIYKSVFGYYGKNHVMPGREALRVAAVYHNRLDHANAHIWYEKGYQILKGIKNHNFESDIQYILACGKMTREARNMHQKKAMEAYTAEFESYVEKLLQNDRYTSEEKELIRLEYYYSLLEKAKFCLNEGKLTESKRLYASIDEWMKSRDDLLYRRVAFEDFHVSLLIAENRYEEAENQARINLEKTALYRGEKYKDYIVSMEMLADILRLSGKWDEALSLYEKILIRLQSDYNYDTVWIDKVISKIELRATET